MIWTLLHPRMTYAGLGLLPEFLSEADPRPAREQFNEGYRHGGGWRPMSGFRRVGGTLLYPGDPPLRPLARTQLRDELIVLHEYEIVCVVQPDGTFEACRMD